MLSRICLFRLDQDFQNFEDFFFEILKNRVVIALMQSRPRQICYEHLLFKSYFWKVLVSCTNTLWYSEGGTLKLLSVQTRLKVINIFENNLKMYNPKI
jgi:hypothetical protein